jgi:hypothetical protein
MRQCALARIDGSARYPEWTAVANSATKGQSPSTILSREVSTNVLQNRQITQRRVP